MKSLVAGIIGRRKTWWPIARFILGIGLAGLAFSALNGQRDELVGATSELTHLRIGWLIVAAILEVASFASFGGLQRRLLRAGQVQMGIGESTGLSLAAGAIASSIPAGPAFASVFAFRFYRRKGANEALAGWTLLATLVCAALALGIIAAIGVALAFSESASYDLIGVIFGVLLITIVADAVVLQRRWLGWVLQRLFRITTRLIGRPRRPGDEVVEGLQSMLATVRLSPRDLLDTLGYAVSNWLFDCSALVFSFFAVGAAVPWRGLLLAYGAAQLAANLPITPGGLGVVEGSLTIALVAFGGAELSTVAAVLCYRIVSFWGYLPVGWLSWLIIELRRRRADRRVGQMVHLPIEIAGALATVTLQPNGQPEAERGGR